MGTLGGLPGLAAGGIDFDQVRRRGELPGFALFWGFPPAPHFGPVAFALVGLRTPSGLCEGPAGIDQVRVFLLQYYYSRTT